MYPNRIGKRWSPDRDLIELLEERHARLLAARARCNIREAKRLEDEIRKSEALLQEAKR